MQRMNEMGGGHGSGCGACVSGQWEVVSSLLGMKKWRASCDD